MESVGKGRSAGSAVLLLIIGSAISSGFPGQLGEGAVRRVRIVPSSTLISAKLLSRAVHAQKRTVKIFTLVHLGRKITAVQKMVLEMQLRRL